MASQTSSLSSPRPYVGPQPFERGQKNFYGRKREEADLFDLVTSHREVLLYAVSGAGKTSLLNAGLIPKLEKEGFRVLGPSRVSAPLPDNITLSHVANPYVFNILRTWKEEESDSSELVSKSLTDLFKRDGPETVLIFDQLEEIFEVFRDRWETRIEFFQQITKLLRDRPEIRVVFSIREDYLAHLLRFKDTLPDRLKTTYSLSLLSDDAARLAIVEPLRNWDPPKVFAEGVPDTLVRELLRELVIDDAGNRVQVEGEFVEPVQLQVVCQRLWDVVKDGVEEINGIETITADHLETIYSVSEALSDFYVECLSKARSVSPQTQEHQLRKFFGEKLITPAGTRAFVYGGPPRVGRTVSEENRKEGSADSVEGIPHNALDVLVDLHLIRKEQRAGADWYELTHDRFIEPIQTSNEAWLNERRATLIVRRYFEDRARSWIKSGRSRRELLETAAFLEAERWSKSPEAAEIGFSAKVQEFIDQSRLEIKRSAENRRVEEEARKREAELANERAEVEKKKADVERQRAEQQEQLATAESARAESERQRAEQQEQLATAESARAESERLRAERERQVTLNVKFGRAIVAALALLAVAALYVAIRSYAHSQVRALAADSMRLSDIDAHQSILRALEAYQFIFRFLAPTDEAAQALQRSVLLSRTKFILKEQNQGDGRLFGVAFSPTENVLATAGTDGIRLWDLSDGKLIRLIKTNIGEIHAVKFSPDGRWLATASDDGTARIWELSGTNPYTFPVDASAKMPAFNVAFDPNGKRLAVASFGVAFVWDIENPSNNEPLLRLPSDPRGPVFDVTFSRDGKSIATSDISTTATIWDAESGRVKKRCGGRKDTGHTGFVYSVSFNDTGDRLATASLDQTAIVWDLSNSDPEYAEEKLVLRGHRNMLLAVAYSDDGKLVATAGADGVAKIWDAETAHELLTLSGHNSLVFGISFSRNHTEVATASWDGTARVWSISGGLNLIGHNGEIKALSYSEDGKYLATGSADGTVKIWDAERGIELETYKNACSRRGSIVTSVAFGKRKSGNNLATGCHDGTLWVWRETTAGSWEQKQQLAFPREKDSPTSNPIFRIAYDADGSRIAASTLGMTQIWDAATGVSLQTLQQGNLVLGVAFSPDGKHLATSNAASYASIWEISSGKELHRFPAKADDPGAHKGWVNAIAFSPDGKLIVTASSDKTIKVWNADGTYSFTIPGHNSLVNDVAFGNYPVARFLRSKESITAMATASSDATAKLWDINSGKATLLATFSAHKGIVNSIAFSPNGKYLASVGADGSIHLNILDEDELRNRAALAARRMQ